MIEEQMRTNLGDPKTCPHGNPMPGFESSTSCWILLAEIAPGEIVIIRRVHELGENDPHLMKFLEENGIIPGALVQVLDTLPFNQTTTLKVKDHPVSIGFSIIKFIYVEKVPLI